MKTKGWQFKISPVYNTDWCILPLSYRLQNINTWAINMGWDCTGCEIIHWNSLLSTLNCVLLGLDKWFVVTLEARGAGDVTTGL